eukprot:CAMPEP_0171896328 /NCGR_PEP_ID=MMETSP0992-20121227/47515_1 /TAXON_ID=483369 /ORGANISM="non described non described, Strain CCMP2098" /LENGTH=924 /DNA_ID=CAMNT_0012524325 /DNA_START=89 /DNA_END=2861 /DNA_ORIENTATION=-
MILAQSSLEAAGGKGDGFKQKHRANQTRYDDPVNPALKGGTEDRAFMAVQEAEFAAEINELQADILTEEKLRRLAGTRDLTRVTSLDLVLDSKDRQQGAEALGWLLPSLHTLVLDGSCLSSLRDLGTDLKGLTSLSLTDAGLEELDGISALPSLRSLKLRNNRVNDLTPLCMHESLQVLDLSYNLVSDLDSLAMLGTCPKLYSLDLRGNLLEILQQQQQQQQQQEFLYALLVIYHVPLLKVLDGRHISPSEAPLASAQIDEGYLATATALLNASRDSPSSSTLSAGSDGDESSGRFGGSAFFALAGAFGQAPVRSSGSGVVGGGGSGGSGGGVAPTDAPTSPVGSSSLTQSGSACAGGGSALLRSRRRATARGDVTASGGLIAPLKTKATSNGVLVGGASGLGQPFMLPSTLDDDDDGDDDDDDGDEGDGDEGEGSGRSSGPAFGSRESSANSCSNLEGSRRGRLVGGEREDGSEDAKEEKGRSSSSSSRVRGGKKERGQEKEEEKEQEKQRSSGSKRRGKKGSSSRSKKDSGRGEADAFLVSASADSALLRKNKGDKTAGARDENESKATRLRLVSNQSPSPTEVTNGSGKHTVARGSQPKEAGQARSSMDSVAPHVLAAFAAGLYPHSALLDHHRHRDEEEEEDDDDRSGGNAPAAILSPHLLNSSTSASSPASLLLSPPCASAGGWGSAALAPPPLLHAATSPFPRPQRQQQRGFERRLEQEEGAPNNLAKRSLTSSTGLSASFDPDGSSSPHTGNRKSRAHGWVVSPRDGNDGGEGSAGSGSASSSSGGSGGVGERSHEMAAAAVEAAAPVVPLRPHSAHTSNPSRDEKHNQHPAFVVLRESFARERQRQHQVDEVGATNSDLPNATSVSAVKQSRTLDVDDDDEDHDDHEDAIAGGGGGRFDFCGQQRRARQHRGRGWQ